MNRIAIILLLLVGCSSPATRGDSCAVVAAALCEDVAPECASIVSDRQAECFQWAMGWCCEAEGRCSDEANDPDLAACDSAIRAEDCSGDDINIPEECGL